MRLFRRERHSFRATLRWIQSRTTYAGNRQGRILLPRHWGWGSSYSLTIALASRSSYKRAGNLTVKWRGFRDPQSSTALAALVIDRGCKLACRTSLAEFCLIIPSIPWCCHHSMSECSGKPTSMSHCWNASVRSGGTFWSAAKYRRELGCRTWPSNRRTAQTCLMLLRSLACDYHR